MIAMFIGEKINRIQAIPEAVEFYSFYEMISPPLDALPLTDADQVRTKEIRFKLTGKDADGRLIYEQIAEPRQ